MDSTSYCFHAIKKLTCTVHVMYPDTFLSIHVHLQFGFAQTHVPHIARSMYMLRVKFDCR